MRTLAVVFLAAAACATDPLDTATTAPAPLTGVDGSHDTADRACNIVLRGLERDNLGGAGFETHGDTWVFSGHVEISAAAAAAGLIPSIMWQRPGDQIWQFVGGTPAAAGSATPGYASFTFDIDRDAPGPNTLGSSLVVAPFIPMPGGGRLFDHNRNPGDFDNYTLAAPDFAVWGAPAACAAPSTPQATTLTFASDFSQSASGPIVAGGTVAIAYDSSRLAQCHEVQGGHPQWGITAWVKFDDGSLVSANVLDQTATVTVPTDGVKSLAMWFEATNVSGCHAYDSNLGANYTFGLALAPQWLGLAGNLITRDSDYPCLGASDAATGMSFDTWARERAAVANLCFQVYQPGETDTADPDLWKQLDAQVHYRFVSGTNASAWASSPVSLAGSAGNNAQYAWSWRSVDPFRDFHCPEVPAVLTSDNMYVQISIEYYIDVNGGEIRPEPGASFGGTFIDYPANPWRTANCQ